MIASAKFTQKHPVKRCLGYQKQLRSCQEKLKDHFSKKRGVVVVKSCSNRQLRKSEEIELNAILDPILNISKPRKACALIDRGSNKKGVVCEGGKLVGERFKKSIRRFKVEGFVCVPSLYKYDKEDPKLVRTRSDSCVYYKEYTFFGPTDRSKPKTAPKTSAEDHYGLQRTEVSNSHKKYSERLPPTAPEPSKPESKPTCRPTVESAFRMCNDAFQKPKNAEILIKPNTNLQTSSSGSIDEIMVKDFTRPIRNIQESERSKIQPVSKKTMALRGKKYTNLLESIKQTIAAIRERGQHSQTAAREMKLVRMGDGKSGLKMPQAGKINAPYDHKKEENGCRNHKLAPLEHARVKGGKQTTDAVQKIEDTHLATRQAQIEVHDTNQMVEISDTSSGSYKTANSVRSQTNQSNLSESADMAECEAPKGLTRGRISEGKNRCDKVPDGKKLGKVGRNPDRTPLRVMNYSFEGHVTFPAKSSVREKSESFGASELSIGIGRAEGVKKDGQYGSNFALKASKSHFDLTTSLRGGSRQHGGRRK